jgi:hypothetical protein
MDGPQDESAASIQKENKARNVECRPLFHLTDEEWLRGLIECPRLLDVVCKTPDERLRLQESLRQWQESGYPDLKSLREGKWPDVSQPPPHKSVGPTRKSFRE